MLTHIPVISPIEVTLGETGIRRLPPPDYEIHALPAAALSPEDVPPQDPAVIALDEMERVAQISEYHDFSWWDDRIRIIRARLESQSPR
ncbi:MAG: hypothetical protein M3R65_06170 [Gemmatimonadota bacterium]|nr:hypothetical protein [Gemmatimonadota bacterium]